MRDGGAAERGLGDLLQEIVNRVAHRGGRTLAIMSEASVTLHQVLLLRALAEAGGSTLSDLAPALNMSPPSVSQMIDRLYQLNLVTRVEMEEDRRKKRIAPTRAGRALLERVYAARSAEYEAGVAPLSRRVRAQLRTALSQALDELATARERPV